MGYAQLFGSLKSLILFFRQMRKELLSLTFLALLLIPALSLLPSAQTSGYDWAISAYSSNLDGYSSYQVNFANFSYFKLNNTGFNSIAEMFNFPLNATGVWCVGYEINGFDEVLVQLALLDYGGTYCLDTNFVLIGPSAHLYVVLTSNPIPYNPQNGFTITAYNSGNKWYAYFSSAGQTISFPGFPIYSGDVIKNIQVNGIPAVVRFFNVPTKTVPIQYNGYTVYPSVSVEVNAPSQTSFTSANPYFVTLFQIYVNNEPYNSAWSGQNLVSADSDSFADDSGAMIGASAPPSDIAWGADEYIYTYSYHYSPYYLKYTYWFDVSYWLLGTQNGIKAFAGLNGLPINDPANGYFVNLVTSPQQQIAVPSYTYSSPV